MMHSYLGVSSGCFLDHFPTSLGASPIPLGSCSFSARMDPCMDPEARADPTAAAWSASHMGRISRGSPTAKRGWDMVGAHKLASNKFFLGANLPASASHSDIFHLKTDCRDRACA